jgi:hypothetical protein
VCWVILKSFRHFYFSDLANGREQKCPKRVLKRLQLYHHQHVKIYPIDSTMFKPFRWASHERIIQDIETYNHKPFTYDMPTREIKL